MKIKPSLNFNMLISALAIVPKNNSITFKLPNFHSPTQNHHHFLVSAFGFSTFTAIGIERCPKEAEVEENIAVYARRLYEQGQLKDAIDHLYRMKQPDNVQVTRDTAMGRMP